jgi:hypothetical protein
MTATLRVPRHGHGALLTGGQKGNRGGPGRRPSLLRERLRGSLAERIPVLEAIADGEVMEHTEVRLADILPHVRCPTCRDSLTPIAGGVRETVRIGAMVSTAPNERINAVALLARFGLGTNDAISVELVGQKLIETYQILGEELDAEMFDRVNARMAQVWR